MNITDFRGEKVVFDKGDFKNTDGIFRGISGWCGYGAVCKIDVGGKILEFSQDFFVFEDPLLQEKWERDDEDFLVDSDKKDIVKEMVDSLIGKAEEEGVNLKGITVENFNSFLDDAFADGGETRCIYFTDLSIEYGNQFGSFESREADEARWECIHDALKILENTFTL
ncbi:MAG: hypothetical protein ACOCQR_02950 [bacterium]